jgi:uncharacterized protein with PIN domain
VGQATPRLLVDENLRGLARWLRFLGFDAALAEGWSDQRVVETAQMEHRLLLTRDRELAARLPASAVLRLEANATRPQLLEVLRKVSWPARTSWFERCVKCNLLLEEMPADKARASGQLPPSRIVVEGERFRRCGACGRVYWQGSHYERVTRYLEGVLAEV